LLNKKIKGEERVGSRMETGNYCVYIHFTLVNKFRKKNELSITNHKITEFFPVRRSNRKSAKEVEVSAF
jgi:hypothetical protein